MVDIMAEEDLTPTEEVVDTTAATPEQGVATEQATQEATVEAKTVTQEDYNKLYFQMKQGERDLEALKQSQTEPAPKAQPTGELKLEDFDYDEGRYNAAVISKQVGEQVTAALATQSAAAQKQAVEKQQSEALQGFNAKASEYAATNPAYLDAINKAPGIQYTKAIQDAILHSPNGPQLDHHLLGNPQLLSELSNMPDSMALMQLGQLQATLKQVAPVKVSGAPEPIATTGGAARPTSDFRYNTGMTMEEYYAAHQAAKQ